MFLELPGVGGVHGIWGDDGDRSAEGTKIGEVYEVWVWGVVDDGSVRGELEDCACEWEGESGGAEEEGFVDVDVGERWG